MKKINIGDIFEIETPKGKAHIHYIYSDSLTGELIRVLNGIYKVEPNDLENLASKKEQFIISFPIKAAFKKDIVKKVGNYSKIFFEKPKFMRTQHNIRGEFLGWHIVDTNTWKRELVLNLNSEQKKLSPWGIWNDSLLIERLVSGWNLENWE